MLVDPVEHRGVRASHQRPFEPLETVAVLLEQRLVSLAHLSTEHQEHHVAVDAEEPLGIAPKPLADRLEAVAPGLLLDARHDARRHEEINELHDARGRVAAHGHDREITEVIGARTADSLDERVGRERRECRHALEVLRAVRRRHALDIDPYESVTRRQVRRLRQGPATPELDRRVGPPEHVDAGGFLRWLGAHAGNLAVRGTKRVGEHPEHHRRPKRPRDGADPIGRHQESARSGVEAP